MKESDAGQAVRDLLEKASRLLKDLPEGSPTRSAIGPSLDQLLSELSSGGEDPPVDFPVEEC